MPSWTASNATLAGSPPSGPRTTGDAHPLAPGRQLVGGGGPEGVGGAEQDRAAVGRPATRASLPQVVVLPVPLTPTTSTTAGCRPACWRCRSDAVHGRVRRASAAPRAAWPRTSSAGSGAEDLDLGPQPVDELGGRGDADVGDQQGLLDLLPGASSMSSRTAAPAGPCRASTATRASRPRSRTSRPAVGSGTLERRSDGLGGLTRATDGVHRRRGVCRRLAWRRDRSRDAAAWPRATVGRRARRHLSCRRRVATRATPAVTEHDEQDDDQRRTRLPRRSSLPDPRGRRATPARAPRAAAG